MEKEFEAAGVLDSKVPSIRVDVEVKTFSVSSPKFFVPGEWRMGIVLRSVNGAIVSTEIKHTIEEFSSGAASGCKAAAVHFSKAIEKLLNAIGDTDGYAKLFQLDEAAVQAYLEQLNAIDAARLAAYVKAQDGPNESEKLARTACKDSDDCSRKFALTQIFISEHADMQIQLATDAIIETFNPIEIMKVGAKAM